MSVCDLLENQIRSYALEYKRLKESGELDRYDLTRQVMIQISLYVKEPTQQMHYLNKYFQLRCEK